MAENYPQLHATQNFADLQAQLEGTENRIAVERGRFNDAVQQYDTAIKTFPALLYSGAMGFTSKPYFAANTAAQTPPQCSSTSITRPLLLPSETIASNFRLCPVPRLAVRAGKVIPPPPAGYFNDYANVVSASTAQPLDQILEQFERDTSNQIVVAIYPKMQSDSSIEDYTVRVAESWKVGQR